MKAIDDNNYEIWLLRYADGDLTSSERKNVEQWLEKHPEATEELRLYGEAPRLERNAEVKYEASLPGATVSLWPKVLRWSAAAAVVTALCVPAVRMFMPHEEPVLSAEADIPVAVAPLAPQECSPTEEVVKHRIPQRSSRLLPTSTSPNTEAESPSETMVDVYDEMPINEVDEVQSIVPVEEYVVQLDAEAADAVEPQLIYVDNLITVDSGNVFEQRLIAANESVKERLQGTYIGRRIARRLPTDYELLDYTGNLREQVPMGVRMVTDMLIAFNDTNKNL